MLRITYLNTSDLNGAISAGVCYQFGHHIFDKNVEVSSWCAIFSIDWIKIGNSSVHTRLIRVVETVRAEERTQGIADRIIGTRDS